MEKRIKIFWIAGFFLPAINATVFNLSTNHNTARHCQAVLLLVERFAVGRTGVRQCDGKPEGN